MEETHHHVKVGYASTNVTENVYQGASACVEPWSEEVDALSVAVGLAG
jgi:hypothetical protein